MGQSRKRAAIAAYHPDRLAPLQRSERRGTVNKGRTLLGAEEVAERVEIAFHGYLLVSLAAYAQALFARVLIRMYSC